MKVGIDLLVLDIDCWSLMRKTRTVEQGFAAGSVEALLTVDVLSPLEDGRPLAAFELAAESSLHGPPILALKTTKKTKTNWTDCFDCASSFAAEIAAVLEQVADTVAIADTAAIAQIADIESVAIAEIAELGPDSG